MLHRLVVSIFLLFDLVLIFFFGTNFPYCLASVCDRPPLRSCLKVFVEKHYCYHHFWCDHVCIEPSRPWSSPILGNNDNKLTDFFPQNENSFFVHIYINVLVILTSTWLVVATLLILLLFLIWQLNVFHSFKVCP